MRQCLSLVFLMSFTLPAQALDYYHCVDADGNAYFGEEPSKECKSQFKSLPIIEAPKPKQDSYYSIENQAKRLASTREKEQAERKQKRREELELRLLEQKLRNEQETSKQQTAPASKNDERRVVVLPRNPVLRPRPDSNRQRPPAEQQDPPEQQESSPAYR